MSRYHVSRQMPWSLEGQRVVEIAKGGLDHSGPDKLANGYADEGDYDEPHEAVDAALAIAHSWSLDADAFVTIDAGSTMGGMLELGHDEMSEAELREWADEEEQSLPRCERCGEVMGEESFGHEMSEGYPFCREQCAEFDLEDQLKWEESLVASEAAD